jgi:hypothetical protein
VPNGRFEKAFESQAVALSVDAFAAESHSERAVRHRHNSVKLRVAGWARLPLNQYFLDNISSSINGFKLCGANCVFTVDPRPDGVFNALRRLTLDLLVSRMVSDPKLMYFKTCEVDVS